ncbi:L-arabinose-responsive transcription regulator ARA1 [Colletotrichum orbiculare MAFF 240422]|uniref:L-arabinose-responsive transcription regulator ARA1 n=1 Tax=Colletotrichum orbiculare (strain 104-T / ATCC 96160 / CBS 514.97 / LARS 414 / MAFF 240422) TaxID=1213857 RepID=A0A484FHE5_COLOR|nr:L-arabinose-responsive transcription regulator ARA1 [Colletotrichum orbiculare MAFF 240422]
MPTSCSEPGGAPVPIPETKQGRTITRQRRGCLTCRRRKKKCPQQHPICSHCHRLNLTPHQMARSRQTWAPLTSTEQLAFSHSASSEFLVNGKPDLVHSRRMMLRYYTAHLVFMLTNNLQNNCFLSVLLPMAFECPALMYALAARPKAAAGARVQEEVSSGAMIQLSRRSRHLEAQLREWKCQSYNRDESLVLLAEAYRHGALIHLYRALRRHVPTHREAICRKISESVAAICGISKTMARGCYAETSMIFPLFIAGGEADTAEEVDIVREALCSLNTSRRFRNVEACVDVLDELWQRSGSGADGNDESKTHMDWLDVAKRRGWKMALF